MMARYYVYPEVEEEIDQDEEWWNDEDQDTVEDQRATFRSAWNMYCNRDDN